MDLHAVRLGLKDAATAIEGLNGFGYGPDALIAPAFFPAEVEFDFDSALAIGMDVAVFSCRLLVSKVDDESAQAALDAYMSRSGDMSVKAALEVDRTLGGACVEVFVSKAVGPKLYKHGLIDYLGVAYEVRVTGRGE